MAAAVTGLAGPQGDGSQVPVGTVWVAIACREVRQSARQKGGIVVAKKFHFTGLRNEIRLQAAFSVFEVLFTEAGSVKKAPTNAGALSL